MHDLKIRENLSCVWFETLSGAVNVLYYTFCFGNIWKKQNQNQQTKKQAQTKNTHKKYPGLQLKEILTK